MSSTTALCRETRGEFRRRAALDVVHFCAFVRDDERAFELAHVLGVDAKVGLQRHRDFDAGGHVDKRTARPHRRIEGGEFVVGDRNDGRKVFLDDVRVLLYRGIHVAEENAGFLEFGRNVVVDDFGFVLGGNAGQELALGFGNSQTIERALDVLGNVVPRALGAIRRLHEIVDVRKVDFREQRRIAPSRHRLARKNVKGFQPERAHPFRLVFHRADAGHDFRRQALFGLEDVVLRVVKAVPIVLNRRRGLQLCRHALRLFPYIALLGYRLTCG